MIDQGKKNILGILVDAVDYESAVERVVVAARCHNPLAVTALAVHGLMTGYFNPEQKYRLNNFDLVVPDGQPLRWAVNWIHNARLLERVYGPNLMLKVCQRMAAEGLPIFLYGSTNEVLSNLIRGLKMTFPSLKIVGSEPSLFRQLTSGEKKKLIEKIGSSGSALVFVGLGCPRQEVWTYEFHRALSIPVIAIGAAFNFHAGLLAQAPAWMQHYGLEWLFRLVVEPRRLWRRYLLLNPAYLVLILLQRMGIEFSTSGSPPQRELMFG